MREFVYSGLLTVDLLRDSFEGRYVGRIASVTPERVFNKHHWKPEMVPMITFDDGIRWIPNMGARRDLIKAWGEESDDWIGQSVAISLVSKTQTEKESGRLIEKFAKVAEPLAAEKLRAVR